MVLHIISVLKCTREDVPILLILSHEATQCTSERSIELLYLHARLGMVSGRGDVVYVQGLAYRLKELLQTFSTII